LTKSLERRSNSHVCPLDLSHLVVKIFSFVFLCCRLKIFAPIAMLAWAVLVPVNWTNNELELAKHFKNVTSSDIDKLTISNIPEGSNRFVPPISSVCVCAFRCFKMLV